MYQEKVKRKSVKSMDVQRLWKKIEDHPNTILLFRCGYYYKSFNEDAPKVAKTCGITTQVNLDVRDKDCNTTKCS